MPKRAENKLQMFILASSTMKNDPDYPIFEAGLREGEMKMKSKTLGFLQNKYLGADAPERGSPGAHAILELAKELSEYLNNG